MPSAVEKPAHAPGRVPAVARALAVMDLLARERRPMHMAAVATALQLPKSSVHGLCSTLMSFGYLKRTDSGALQIGPGVMSLAEAFVAGTRIAGEFEALWQGAGAPEQTLVLSVLSGADVVYVAVRHSMRPLGLAFNVGMKLPAHLAATGKAMLAHLPPAEAQALLPAEHWTPALAAELAAARDTGFGIDDGGVREGVYSVAAPVFDASGRPVAGIGLCINKTELASGGDERQRQVVRQAAQRLSMRLGARGELS